MRIFRNDYFCALSQGPISPKTTLPQLFLLIVRHFVTPRWQGHRLLCLYWSTKIKRINQTKHVRFTLISCVFVYFLTMFFRILLAKLILTDCLSDVVRINVAKVYVFDGFGENLGYLGWIILLFLVHV